MPKLTYKSSGVNYDLLDNLKRMAQNAAGATFFSLADGGFVLDKSSIGESAQVFTFSNISLAVVQEGLGTKNLIADEMEIIDESKHWYKGIAQDTVAMIINDLITVGAHPVSISAYWGIGNSAWLEDECKAKDLVEGWQRACIVSGASWLGGETPVLPDVINKKAVDLAGVGLGVISKRKYKNYVVTGNNLQAGDAIILFESSGIHANGTTLARKLADTLPDGYKTILPNGKMFGEALLAPTIIYAKVINELFEFGVDIHYMVNITGHGWRKLMRHTNSNLQYVINGEVPEVPEVLKFIQVEAELTDKEAYATFNMGAGFAIFVPQNDVQNILKVAKENNIKAYNAGIVQEGEKQVIIQPKNIIFSADSLRVR